MTGIAILLAAAGIGISFAAWASARWGADDDTI